MQQHFGQVRNNKRFISYFGQLKQQQISSPQYSWEVL
jgi:hypothetical protein